MAFGWKTVNVRALDHYMAIKLLLCHLFRNSKLLLIYYNFQSTFSFVRHFECGFGPGPGSDFSNQSSANQ